MITQEAICVTLGQVHRNHEECCNIKPCPQTNQQPTPVLQKSSLRASNPVQKTTPVLQKSSLRGATLCCMTLLLDEGTMTHIHAAETFA